MDASRQVLVKLIKGSVFCANCSSLGRSLLATASTRTHVLGQNVRCVASLAEQFKIASDSKQKNVKTVFRTNENSPLKHSIKDEGLHYTLSPQVLELLQKGLPLEFRKQAKTFREACMMVRQPALEVTNYIRHLNLDHPVTRILLYGRRGSGRSMTLAHLMHYCMEDKWVIVHVPWPSNWNFNAKDISPSSHRSGRIDLPAESEQWLMNFRLMNQLLLEDVKTHCSYTWTKRESAEEGTPLLDIVDFGLNRAKFASDCVGVVLKELKYHASSKRLKVMVAIDGVNSFWAGTRLVNEEKQNIPAHNLSLVHNFKKLLKNDWMNGVIVCTVDTQANDSDHRENYTPHYLLGKEGFEWLDPFIPVEIPYFSEKEAYSCIEYFLERNWIQAAGAKTEEGKKELIFLSNRNPYQLARVCASK